MWVGVNNLSKESGRPWKEIFLYFLHKCKNFAEVHLCNFFLKKKTLNLMQILWSNHISLYGEHFVPSTVFLSAVIWIPFKNENKNTFRHCNSHIFQVTASPLTSWFCYFLCFALFSKKREASSMDKNFHNFYTIYGKQILQHTKW